MKLFTQPCAVITSTVKTFFFRRLDFDIFANFCYSVHTTFVSLNTSEKRKLQVIISTSTWKTKTWVSDYGRRKCVKHLE